MSTSTKVFNLSQLHRAVNCAPQSIPVWLSELEIQPIARDALGRLLFDEHALRALERRARGVVEFEVR